MKLNLVRCGVVAATLAAFSAPLLTPKPAAAWWAHPGYYGWHHGWGWRPGWGYCCGGPRVVIGGAPGVWIPGHWAGAYWVPGHWR